MADVLDLTMPFNYGLFPLAPLPGLPGRMPARPPPETLLDGGPRPVASWIGRAAKVKAALRARLCHLRDLAA
jgi:hypothetical protein